jgi:hypothetical protein
MKNGRWFTATILSLLVISIVAIQTASSSPFYGPEPPPWRDIFLHLLLIKTILSSLNSILLTLLLVTYIGIYRKTRSEFSIGLVVFSIALLLYSLTSNPLIHGIAGFRVSGLGPFTMLPDLFTCIASAILLYLSRQ